jgi:hypothetical protein
MSTVLEIEDAIQRLPRSDQEALREWLENLLEDQLVLRDEFKSEIEAGQRDLTEGKTRSRPA